jgi:hypothetical protein
MRACIGGCFSCAVFGNAQQTTGKFILRGDRGDRDRFLPIFVKAAMNA